MCIFFIFFCLPTTRLLCTRLIFCVERFTYIFLLYDYLKIEHTVILYLAFVLVTANKWYILSRYMFYLLKRLLFADSSSKMISFFLYLKKKYLIVCRDGLIECLQDICYQMIRITGKGCHIMSRYSNILLHVFASFLK